MLLKNASVQNDKSYVQKIDGEAGIVQLGQDIEDFLLKHSGECLKCQKSDARKERIPQ